MSFSKMFDHLGDAFDNTVKAVSDAGRNARDSAGALLDGDIEGGVTSAAKATGSLATGGLSVTASGFKAVNNLRRGALGAAEEVAREIYDPLGDVVVIVAEATGGSADD